MYKGAFKCSYCGLEIDSDAKDAKNIKQHALVNFEIRPLVRVEAAMTVPEPSVNDPKAPSLSKQARIKRENALESTRTIFALGR